MFIELTKLNFYVRILLMYFEMILMFFIFVFQFCTSNSFEYVHRIALIIIYCQKKNVS